MSVAVDLLVGLVSEIFCFVDISRKVTRYFVNQRESVEAEITGVSHADFLSNEKFY